jgi:DNA polymerase-1
MRTLLIDGDVVAYQFATTAETPIHWGDDFWTLHANAAEAKARMDNYLEELKTDLEADYLIIALSDRTRNYFRKKLLPSYKASRDNIRKPLILKELRMHLQTKYESFERPGLEGDDVLGILATSPKIVRGEKVIVSIDKDLKTIPGLHYNTNKPELGVYKISEEEADYWHLFQTLTGDASDGYPGCPGIGPKKAADILAERPSWEVVLTTFKKAGISEEEALTQARIARIVRARDYDFERKTVKILNVDNVDHE